MKQPANYEIRIGEIKRELLTRTIGEAEDARGISSLDYTGVGFGYNLKPNRPKTIQAARRDVSEQ